MAGGGKSWQAFDDTLVEALGTVEAVPRDPTNGTDGIASADQVAADLRRKELLRPEDLLPVRAVAERLGLSAATVHNDINVGKLRCILFGSVRRVRPEDCEAYGEARRPFLPPAGEDWCAVAEMIRATGVSRSQAYRLLARGIVPFQVFSGTRYVRLRDLATPRRRS